jgi:putative membrane protein
MIRTRISRPVLMMLVLWALIMIIQPIVLWTWGQTALQRGLSLAVLVQAATVLLILGQAWGLKRTTAALVLVAITSFFVEWAGSQTGFPFGKYHYTDVLQPQLQGVPLLIPLAWMMMLPPAWAIAHQISRKSGRSISFVLLAALAFTVWDLFLDPQMVGWNFWVWEIPGRYFGIPLVNFLGWFLVSAFITWIANPVDLPDVPLIAVYVITWLLQTIGQAAFWGQPGPALFGFLAMGALVFLARKPGFLRLSRTF